MIGSKVSKLKKRVAELDEKYIINVMDGVVSDVVSNAYPRETNMGVFTLGEMNDIGGFYSLDWMLDDMIGTVLGRAVRMLCLDLRMTEKDMADRQVLNILMSTNDVQQKSIPKVREYLVNKYGNKPINQEVEAKMYERLEMFHQMATMMFGG